MAMRRSLLHVFILYFTATTEEAIAGCLAPLGLQSRAVNDAQLSASTSMSDYQLPSAGRLHNSLNLNSFGAWCPAQIDTDQWFQIDLLTTTNLSAVASQGVQVSDGEYWVTAYSLNYSCDGVKWFPYMLHGLEAVFQGNNDSSTVITNKLPFPIVARFIRVRPLAWNVLGSICLRLELYGCQTSRACPHPTRDTTMVVATTSTIHHSSKRKTSSTRTRKRPTHLTRNRTLASQGGVVPTNATPIACSHALGMQSGKIKNSQINASSFKSLWTRPSEGRLHNQRSAQGTSLGGWCAKDFDKNPYLQVDLVNNTIVTAIGTQGLPGIGNWASKYQLSYSCDGKVWFEYLQGKVFKANKDSRLVVVNRLPVPLRTRLVRLWPQQSGQYGTACVRLEIYGCTLSGVVRIPGKNTATPNSTEETENAETTRGTRGPTEPKEKNMIVIVRAHDQTSTQEASSGYYCAGNIYLLMTCLLWLLHQL